MPLTTTIQTLTEFRNTIAELLGFSAYSALDTLSAAHIDKAMGFAMDGIALEGNWKWLEREGSFTTAAGYSTGTVDLTNLSTGVEGTGTAWATGTNVLAGDKANFGEGGYYRIASVTDADTLVLATEFAGTTASATTYNTYRDEYALADGVLELLSIRQLDPSRQLIMLSPHEWEEITHGDWEVGEPEYAMLIGSNASVAGNAGTNQKLQLYPIPSATRAYTYTYRSLASLSGTGSDNLEFGPQLSTLLIYKAMEDIYRQRQEPERMAEYQAAYVQLLAKAKRSEMGRTRRARFISSKQWGARGGYWPTNWPDVTNP